MNIQVDSTSSNLASAMLNSKIRPRAVVGYGVKIFHPSPPNYVTRPPGVDSSSLSEDNMVSNNLETSDHKMQLLHAVACCLNEGLSNLKSRSAKTETELMNSEKELKRLSQET